jgi:hypothetical protein
MNASSLGISNKSVKLISVFDLKAFVCKKLDFRTFSPAARRSSGEQLSPILIMKSEISLTQVPTLTV